MNFRPCHAQNEDELFSFGLALLRAARPDLCALDPTGWRDVLKGTDFRLTNGYTGYSGGFTISVLPGYRGLHMRSDAWWVDVTFRELADRLHPKPLQKARPTVLEGQGTLL